jgi:hypothetical protein
LVPLIFVEVFELAAWVVELRYEVNALASRNRMPSIIEKVMWK